jgi:hypothetical protein
MSACAGAVHATAAVVACVALGDDVEAPLEVIADASGVALGAFAVVPAHPMMTAEKIVAAMSRIADIMQAVALRAL